MMNHDEPVDLGMEDLWRIHSWWALGQQDFQPRSQVFGLNNQRYWWIVMAAPRWSPIYCWPWDASDMLKDWNAEDLTVFLLRMEATATPQQVFLNNNSSSRTVIAFQRTCAAEALHVPSIASLGAAATAGQIASSAIWRTSPSFSNARAAKMKHPCWVSFCSTFGERPLKGFWVSHYTWYIYIYTYIHN